MSPYLETKKTHSRQVESGFTIRLHKRLFMLLWLVIPMLFIGWLATSFTIKYINLEKEEKATETQLQEIPREVPAYEN